MNRMKDENKTKVELIKELKTLQKEREKSALDNITERKQVEIREKQLITKMDFLYKTALDFIQLDPKDDIYRFIGRKLKEIVGDSIVLVNSYDKASDSFHVRALEGVREKIKKVLKVTGKDIFSMSFPINNEEAKSQLISGELLKVPGDLNELSFGQIPKSICHVLEKFLNVGEIYFSGFAKGKELFGDTIIILPKKVELNNRELINTFIKQSAIMLQSKQAEGELKDSEGRLKILFDYAPDAYYINDLKGNFFGGNKAAEKVIGYKKEELIGKNFLKLKLLSLTDIPKAAKALAKNIMGQPTGPDEFVLNRKDNSKVTVEISTYPVKIKGKTLVLGIARDITERKQAEEKIKHLNLVLRAIRNVNQLIVREKNRERLLKGACENLVKTRGCYSTWVALLDKKGKLETYAEAGLGKAFLPMIELLKRGKLTTCSQKALKQQGVVTTESPESTCPECPLAQEYSGRGAMTIRLEHSGKVYGLISVSIPAYLAVDQEEQSLFKEVAGDIAFSIHNIELDEELQQSYQRLKKTMDASLDTMSKILEAKDPYTAGHQQRVSQLATAIAKKELNLSPDKVEGIRIASLIHDIGKIGLPTEILSKPTKLTDIEFSLIKGHSQIGYDILKSIDFSYPIAQIVLQHHERLNGSGYPNKLKGDKIMIEALIIGVADVVEAMSSHRPYRPALGIDKALEEISKNRGILYDPEVVDACLKLFKEKGFKFK